jgi:hypothetical protein
MTYRSQHRRIGVGIAVEVAVPEVDPALRGPSPSPFHLAPPVAERARKSPNEFVLVIGWEVVRQEVIELPRVSRRTGGERRRTREKDELVISFAMLS